MVKKHAVRTKIKIYHTPFLSDSSIRRTVIICINLINFTGVNSKMNFYDKWHNESTNESNNESNNESANNETSNNKTNKTDTFKESMVVFASMVEAIRCLPTYEERCAANDIMYDYGIWNIYPDFEDLSPTLQMFFMQLKPNIDANEKRYRKACNDGKNGGRPTKYIQAEIIELLDDGFTIEEVSEKLGCHERTVRRAISASKHQ